MKENRKPKWNRLVVAASLPLLSLSMMASAQYPAQGQDGHANDANNRVGSNGYNGATQSGPAVTGNQIVTRNVTAGKGFRGPVPYRDPSAFMGPSPGRLNDAIVRDTAGVPTQFGAPSDLLTARPFYGDARAVPPPAGTIPEGFSGGYVGTTLSSPSSLSSTVMSQAMNYGLQARANPGLALEQQQNAIANPFSYQNSNPQPGQESFINNGSLSASPLFGLRQAQTGPYPWYNYNATQPGGGDRFKMPETAVQGLQREMMEAAGVRQPSSNGQTKNGQNDTQSRQNANPLVQPLDRPLESPDNSPLSDRSLSTPLNNNQGLNSSINTGAGIRNGFNVPPALQSTQYSALQQRLKQYTAAYGESDEAANSAFQRAVARKNQVEPTLPNQPPVGPRAGGPRQRDIAPLKMDSLSAGIPAKGLHDLMASAEEQLRQDKFAAAIADYDRAARAAPNNPMITLGRAIAELGAGYYAQADRDLRSAYSSGPALMMAQVDLSKMLSADRLQFVKNDLAKLATDNQKDARPWFLQAFIAYNSGNADEAARDLTEAQSRGSRADATIRALLTHWSLASLNTPATQPTQPQANPAPAQQPPADLNK